MIKSCKVVIYSRFAKDAEDVQMRKKLSLSSIAF